jgi:antitoxin component YwqK of YwqJK toxin-antitoxin module
VTKIYTTFLICILTSCNTSNIDCANAVVDEDIKDLADYNSIFYDQGYTGSVNDYYDQTKSNIKKVLHYKNGDIVKYESFYEDGDRKIIKPVMCNSTHGNLIYYMDNNTIGYEMNYKFGRKHGVGKSYYENGYVEKMVQYFENNKNGLQYEFSEKGDTINVEFYKNGEKIK